MGADSIQAAFDTGKGHITLRGVATVEQEGSKAGKSRLPATWKTQYGAQLIKC